MSIVMVFALVIAIHANGSTTNEAMLFYKEVERATLSYQEEWYALEE